MKAIFTFCLCLYSLLSLAQHKESFYALDKDWKQTDEKSAAFILWIHQDSAGNWAYSYYHMWGPLIKMETFKDHDGTIRNGLSCYYYATGNLDSVAHYRDGKKDGVFLKYLFLPNDSLRMAAKYDYVLDSLTNLRDYVHDTTAKENKADTMGNRESAYPGGLAEWQHFLGKNLQYPERAASNEKQGEVRLIFTVDDQGDIIEPVIAKSVEYSLDRESMRIISISGKWEPGLVHGIPSRTFKIQPFRFVLQAE